MGLGYEDIKPFDIHVLVQMLESELLSYLVSGGETGKIAKQMKLRISRPLKKDTQFDKQGKFKSSKIQVDGSYFRGREVITFYGNGEIRFCEELSGCNAAPILKAFYKWCAYLANETEKTT